MLYSNGADAKNKENEAVATLGLGEKKRKRNLSHVMLQTMGFLFDKMKTPPFLTAGPGREKKISKLNGAKMFFYTPFRLQDDGGGRLFYPRPVPSKKKKTLHAGKGFPDLFEFQLRAPV